MDKSYQSVGQSYETPNMGYSGFPSPEYGSPPPIYDTPQPMYGFQATPYDTSLLGHDQQTEYGFPHGGYQEMNMSHQDTETSETHSGRPQSIRGWICFWLSFIVVLAWIVPATVLLAMNLSGKIIGASTWCPAGNCPGVPNGPNQTMADLASEYDHENHNLLGGLQFVAKGIEVWFVYVAVGLVYFVTSLLARSEHGLPIGYLLTYVEFSDLLNAFNPGLWTAAVPAASKDPQKRTRKALRSWAFAIFAAFMCLEANLMGPSVAVLILPTLQWVDMPQKYEQRFGSMLSSDPPTGDSAIPGCTAANLTLQNYNCTEMVYSYSLDALVEYFIAQIQQNILVPGDVTNFNTPPSTEQALALRFNVSLMDTSTSSTIYWAPNRQVIRSLSDDVETYWAAGSNKSSEYAGYNNSLSTVLQRQGPVVGIDWNTWGGNATTTVVDANRQVRCYHSWWFGDTVDDVYAKCFRAGTGWNSSNAISQFTVGLDEVADDPTFEVVTTNAYRSDKAMYIKSTFTPGVDVPPCLPNGTVPNSVACDWDSMFSQPPPVGLPSNLTSEMTNSFIIENTVSTDPAIRLVIEMFLSVGFAAYTTDASIYDSSWGAVTIDVFPSDPQPIVMNSAWLLAAWSASNDTNISVWRISARQLQKTISNLHSTLVENSIVSSDDQNLLYWYLLSINSGLQAASFINFDTTDPSTDGLALGQDDPIRPTLWTRVRRQVWAYGTDSRTSKLGIAVLAVGIVCTLARSILALVTRIRLRSPVELMVAAMKHHPRGEFDLAGSSEMKMARVRFNIQDNKHDHIFFTKK